MRLYGFPTQVNKQNFFRSAIGYLGTFLELIVRTPLIYGLTLLALPVIFLVHAVKYPFVKRLENKFHQLKGELITGEFIYPDSNSTKTVLYLLEHDKLTLNEIYLSNNSAENQQAPIIGINRDGSPLTTAEKIDLDYNRPSIYEHQQYGPHRFLKVTDTTSPKQQKALQAAYELGL